MSPTPGRRRKKAVRDPDAPRKPQTAYILYQNANRAAFGREHPQAQFGELSKIIAKSYAALTHDEKQTWISKAEEARVRYNQAMKAYKPPPGYNNKGILCDSDALPETLVSPRCKGKKGRKNGRNVPRDIHAPAKWMSPYLHYQNYYRERFRKMNPGITFGRELCVGLLGTSSS